MSYQRLVTSAFTAILLLSSYAAAQKLRREQWGAPAISVSHEGDKWIIAGKRNKVTLNEGDLALTVQTGTAQWTMLPSGAEDMLVKSHGKEFYLRLADAQNISIVPYDSGFRTGVKISLGNWKQRLQRLDLKLVLTLGLEGKDEELVFDIAADE